MNSDNAIIVRALLEALENAEGTPFGQPGEAAEYRRVLAEHFAAESALPLARYDEAKARRDAKAEDDALKRAEYILRRRRDPNSPIDRELEIDLAIPF
ncbi:hypothetical protein [Methylobacterium oxalidis]|uniref:Uncharacterized protein n=1 Tax=Methylobacterium oxalidis TaxID=944322 RepID=A0A512IX51_9HYPH|nr:hypothetical protein [Methylobacterium oxalidis]GEP02294.1 hypothetical protein MOX02_03320 [Methylobacterium oxalidis]GJE32284.1 hypothetical protein LDDCCGHA_2470 [Methylobacterium oxalidis]GLS62239.1 hypothetical protein GCM10007888_06200 [Methylobacterium oxalidis]